MSLNHYFLACTGFSLAWVEVLGISITVKWKENAVLMLKILEIWSSSLRLHQKTPNWQNIIQLSDFLGPHHSSTFQILNLDTSNLLQRTHINKPTQCCQKIQNDTWSYILMKVELFGLSSVSGFIHQAWGLDWRRVTPGSSYKLSLGSNTRKWGVGWRNQKVCQQAIPKYILPFFILIQYSYFTEEQ